jgi:hypothetical protein
VAVLHRERKNSRGTLILYPDKLAHVWSPIPFWFTFLGAAVVALVSLVLARSAPGTTGAVVGGLGGQAAGSAIARRQAPAKAAAGGARVTVIPLDSITNVTSRKGNGLRGGQLVVSTQLGPEYTFRLNPAEWPADLASALAARGHIVRASPDGLAVLAAHGS